MGEFEEEHIEAEVTGDLPVAEEPAVELPDSDDAVPETAELSAEQATTAEPQPEQVEPEPTAEPQPEQEPAAEPSADAEPTESLEQTEPVEPPSDEDIAAAVAAAAEQVEVEPTLDDIAPGTKQDAPPVSADDDADKRYGAPWWPFAIYLVLWVAFAGVAVWQLEQLPLGSAVYEAEEYALFVFGGLVLAAAGVFLIPTVWLVSRTSAKRHRAGLFTSAFIKGAGAILIGVVLWWGTIVALDYLRLGRFM